MTKRYWLVKSEPRSFPIDALARSRRTLERRAQLQARNFMRDGMQVGDGICSITPTAPSRSWSASPKWRATRIPIQPSRQSQGTIPSGQQAEEPRWLLVDVRYKRTLKRTITRKNSRLAGAENSR